MALSLGSIGGMVQRGLGFSSPQSNPSQTRNPLQNRGDGLDFSQELMDQGRQSANPVVNAIQETVQQIQLAQAYGGDPSAALQQLQAEVQQAQMQGIQLPPELEAMVQQLLGGAGQQAGGQPMGSAQPAASPVAAPGATPQSGGAQGGGAQSGGTQAGPAPSSGASAPVQNSTPTQAPAPATQSAERPSPNPATSSAPTADITPVTQPATTPTPASWDLASKYDAALHQEPEGFRDPQAWGQNGASNCAAIGVIKAATAESGSDIFQNVEKTDQGYTVTTQDGRTVKLSNEELNTTAKTADLSGDPSGAKAQATLALGVMAKNYAADHPKDDLTFQQALNATNGLYDAKSNPNKEGRLPEEAAKDLGVPFHKADPQSAVNEVQNSGGQKAGVIYSTDDRAHAEAVTYKKDAPAQCDAYSKSKVCEVPGKGPSVTPASDGKDHKADAAIVVDSKHKPEPAKAKTEPAKAAPKAAAKPEHKAKGKAA